MVKGISRRVIVVRSPDPRFFEQAIFLMKEDAFHNSTVSADQKPVRRRQATCAAVLERAAPPGGAGSPKRCGSPWAAASSQLCGG